MSSSPRPLREPRDHRALIAVDLGAESCRVSLLRWVEGVPRITLVHRFANGPQQHDGLRWPLAAMERGVDEGMRQCAALAPEGIRSVAVDGWAVDYVRLDPTGNPLAEPFCYRDERTLKAFDEVHSRISAARLREISGIELSRINTLYQLYADASSRPLATARWLNLPEYMMTRWGAAPVAEYTNATHSGLIGVRSRTWSEEIFTAAGLEARDAPKLVDPGTRLGRMTGTLSELPPFSDTEIIAPACHDTASGIAGIPLPPGDWAYLSSGTWSLIGTVLHAPCNTNGALDEGFTNLGAIGGQTCFHKGMNGMWLLKQCMDTWALAGHPWSLEALVAAAEQVPAPLDLLDVSDPGLLLIGDMPGRINRQRHRRSLMLLDESPQNAPQFAALIFYSLAEAYARALQSIEHHIGRSLRQVIVVGGGSRNQFLNRLLSERTGRIVTRGAPESSTIGNLAVQLAALEGAHSGNTEAFAVEVASWAATLAPLDITPVPSATAHGLATTEERTCNGANS